MSHRVSTLGKTGGALTTLGERGKGSLGFSAQGEQYFMRPSF